MSDPSPALSLPARTTLAALLPVAIAGALSLALVGPRVDSSTLFTLAAVIAAALFAAALYGRAQGLAIVRSLSAATERVEALARSESPDATVNTAPASPPRDTALAALTDALDAVAGRRTEMEADRRRAITTRLEAARLRSFVLAGVSHDLRGPLNSVLGFAGLLLEGIEGPLTEGQRESVVAVNRGGRSLLQRIDDLLDAARLDADRLVLNTTDTTVGAVLPIARDEARHRAALAMDDPVDQGTTDDLAAENTPLRVDAERLGRSLGAMLAWCRVRPGAAGGATVRTVISREGDRVEVRMYSPGSALGPDALAEVFSPFDAMPTGQRVRAGLGLALGVARGVIEANGATVIAEAVDEGGVLLRLSLPVPPPEHSAAGETGDSNGRPPRRRNGDG